MEYSILNRNILFFLIFINFPAIANENKKLYGVQFHPEVDLTEHGRDMMKHFLFDIAKFRGSFTMKGREADCLSYIRDAVGNHKVLVLTSFITSYAFIQ
jgi:GMP synthase (glutamine-hydrolysing)